MVREKLPNVIVGGKALEESKKLERGELSRGQEPEAPFIHSTNTESTILQLQLYY